MSARQPSVISIAFVYLLLIIAAHEAVLLIAPKSTCTCCRQPQYRETKTIRHTWNEKFFCINTPDGFELTDVAGYLSAYEHAPSSHPAVLAVFFWEDKGTYLDRYSPIRVFDRYRNLDVQIRAGVHTNQTAQVDHDSVLLSIADQTSERKYLTGPLSGFSPVVTPPFLILKLVSHILLLALAYHLTKIMKRYIEPKIWRMVKGNPNLCDRCGYDCHDLPSPICPECGNHCSQPAYETQGTPNR